VAEGTHAPGAAAGGSCLNSVLDDEDDTTVLRVSSNGGRGGIWWCSSVNRGGGHRVEARVRRVAAWVWRKRKRRARLGHVLVLSAREAVGGNQGWK
jgi:hypothetical protein